MALYRRRKTEDSADGQSQSENMQSQLEFEKQPESYEASESISNDGDDYSAQEQGYSPEPAGETEATDSSS